MFSVCPVTVICHPFYGATPIWPANIAAAVNPIDPPRPGRGSDVAVAIWAKLAQDLIADPTQTTYARAGEPLEPPSLHD